MDKFDFKFEIGDKIAHPSYSEKPLTIMEKSVKMSMDNVVREYRIKGRAIDLWAFAQDIEKEGTLIE